MGDQTRNMQHVKWSAKHNTTNGNIPIEKTLQIDFVCCYISIRLFIFRILFHMVYVSSFISKAFISQVVSSSNLFVFILKLYLYFPFVEPGIHTVHAHGIPGFTIERFCDCTLHTLDMGVSSHFCGEAIVTALRANIYHIQGKHKMQKGVIKMRGGISAYYSREHRRRPTRKLSKMKSKFTLKMLGPKNLRDPCLKAKGGETRCLVKFCTELMDRPECGERGRILGEAGRQLMQHYDIMEEQPRRMSLTARKRLLETAVNHVTLYKSLGCHLVHKHHAWVHMAMSAGMTGNPKTVSTYEDESENGIISRIGLVVHPSTFARSCFERLELQTNTVPLSKR